MTLSKICSNEECRKVFYKKDSLRLLNWKQKKYCSPSCQTSHNNKQNSMKNKGKPKKVLVNRPIEHKFIGNFLCKYVPRELSQ